MIVLNSSWDWELMRESGAVERLKDRKNRNQKGSMNKNLSEVDDEQSQPVVRG